MSIFKCWPHDSPSSHISAQGKDLAPHAEEDQEVLGELQWIKFVCSYGVCNTSLLTRVEHILAQLRVAATATALGSPSVAVMLLNCNSQVVAIGGGALTDFAGFIAATFKRGIRLTFVPTSLLAQVDASIGGKTAINFGNVKNLVGSFYVPNNVVICSSFLKTLDQQEYLNGLAEVIKHAFITSDEEVNTIFSNIDKINQRDEKVLNETIKRSIKIKADFVIEDFEEKGRRKFLNFGHTFGHGIESSNLESPIFHGHSVVLGMMMAIKYSMRKKLLSEKNGSQAIELISSFNFDFSEIKLDPNEIFQFMKSDKKNQNSQINLVLLKSFGEPVLYEEGNPSELQNFIGDFVEEFRS